MMWLRLRVTCGLCLLALLLVTGCTTARGEEDDEGQRQEDRLDERQEDLEEREEELEALEENLEEEESQPAPDDVGDEERFRPWPPEYIVLLQQDSYFANGNRNSQFLAGEETCRALDVSAPEEVVASVEGVPRPAVESLLQASSVWLCPEHEDAVFGYLYG